MVSLLVASLLITSFPSTHCYPLLTMSSSSSAASPKLPPPPASSASSTKPKTSIVEHFRQRGTAFDVALGISSHVGAAVTAVVELGEDIESIGHGHGMMLLVASRLAREFNLLRSAVVEEVEELAHLKKNQAWWRWPLEPFFFVGRILSTKLMASLLALAALGAAALEVVEDTKPGGHHGAVLLAVNELWELIDLSNILPKKWRFLLKQHLLRLALVSGALIVALMESVEEGKMGKVGGHHGVAIFAFAKILRVVALMRSEVKELGAVEGEVEGEIKEETKKEK